MLAAVALYAHLRTAAAKRARAEELAHLRKVVDAVNGAKDVRWKVSCWRGFFWGEFCQDFLTKIFPRS